jgi:hypothetical protein
VLDESGTLVNLLQLWQLVVRHPDVFYESRDQFMPQMINTLSRIGMPTTATLENRKLSLDLAGLLLRWEAQRRAEAAAAGGGEGGDAAAGGKSGVCFWTRGVGLLKRHQQARGHTHSHLLTLYHITHPQTRHPSSAPSLSHQTRQQVVTSR